MRQVFVVNPRARKGATQHEWSRLRAGFLKDPGTFEHLGPPEEVVSGDFDEWVVVGGDGSLQRSIQALMTAFESKLISKLPRLAVLPLGTGADYSRSLPADGSPIAADLGRVAIDARSPHYFINTCSLGFSARVAEAKERMPAWLPRSLSYLAPTLLELPRAQPIELRLESPAGTIQGRSWAVFVSKGQYAGGGMRFATESRLDDGLFEVSWVEDLPVTGILARMPQLYGRGLREQAGVRKLRCSRLTLECDTLLPLDLDGEPDCGRRIELEVLGAPQTGFSVRLF